MFCLVYAVNQVCPTRGSPCYLVWPALRLKLLKNYIAELNVLFSLICWSSLEPLTVYFYVYCNAANFRVDYVGKVLYIFVRISVGRRGKMSSALKKHLYLL